MSTRRSSIRLVAAIVAAGFLSLSAAGQVRPKILISNDDGTDSRGLEALVNALAAIADVTVAAPSQNRSGTGHGMTFGGPILVRAFEKGGLPWYSIEALPGTCVRLGIKALAKERPELVVSGINPGENTGTVTFYSGTVACAREAAIQGIPAVAISLEAGPVMDFVSAAEFASDLVKEITTKGLLKSGEFLNVNYPALPRDQIKGVLLTRQDTRPDGEIYDRRTGPKGQIYFWPDYFESTAGDEHADIWALRNGYISITPMGFDQTMDRLLSSLETLKGMVFPKRPR